MTPLGWVGKGYTTMTMTRMLLAGAALVAMGATAQAGSLATPKVEPPPVAFVPIVPQKGAWEGGYLGANISWGKGKLAGTDYRPDGTSGGLRAGYDWQTGQTVYGLGVDYNFGKLKDNRLDQLFNTNISGRIEKMGTVYGRVGYDAGEWLPYALVGYSWGDAKLGDSKAKLNGYSLGVGAEYRIDQNWSAYGEYTYTDFGKKDLLNSGTSNKISANVLRVGVNYRF